MKVKIVKSNVQVVSNLDEEQLGILKESLRLKNPAYLSALKFSKWGTPKNIPEYLKYYTILKEGTLLIPIGIDVKSLLNLDNTEVDILDRRVNNKVEYPNFNITLRDSQQEAFNSYLAKKDKEANIITLPTGKGKAQPLDTKILTPKGYKLMRDLRLNDLVIGEDGKPYPITGIYPQGVKEVFRVTFKDGTSTLCCDEHLWKFRTSYYKKLNKPYQVQNLKSIMGMKLKEGKAFNINTPINRPVEFNLGEIIPIDPYVLGCLLGDGCLSLIDSTRQSNLYFSTVESDIIHNLNTNLANLGYFDKNLHTQAQYNFKSKLGVKNNPLLESLRDLKLSGVKSHEKFIPKNYLYSSVEDRLELLKGLFDTDGCVRPNGSYLFSTSSIQLANDIVFLCRSLGYRAILKTKKDRRGYIIKENYTRKSPEHEVTILTNQVIYKSLKHKHRHAQALENTNRTYTYTDLPIVSIEKEGLAECQCISVGSEDHTYLCDDFIVTHNTILGLSIANELKDKTIVIVHKSDLVNGWIKDILECFPELTKKDIGIFKAKSRTIGKQFTIATVQTLARLDEEEIHEFSKNFGFMILDEAHHVGASTFDIVNAFPAKHKLALTATPERADGLTSLLNIFFGDFTYKFNMKTNGDEDILPVHVHVRTLSDVKYEPKFRAKNVNGKITYVLDDDKGTIKYSNVTNKDVLPLIPILQTYGKIYNSDPFINRLSIDIAKEYNEGRSIVVFVSLKEQCEYLMEQLILRGLDPQDVQIYNGDTKDKEKALNLAENNKNFITITTLKIATEGTNVKQWEVLFLATSIKDGKNVEQAVGRIRRVKEGKIPVAKVYDYHLPYCFSVNTHTNSRLNRYSKLNFKVSFSRDY